MRPPRRPRLLSREEAHLWGEIAKLITPLRGRARPKTTDGLPAPKETVAVPPGGAGKVSSKPAPSKPASTKPVPKPAPAVPREAAGKTAPVMRAKAGPEVPSPLRRPARPTKLADLRPPGSAPAPGPAAPPAAPGLPGLERQERRGLHRGSLSIEARIDLHGLYQAEAHAALIGFLMRSRSAGHARVLVVTGKGGAEAGATFHERGVLRRSVPHWLRGPELRGLVIGFEEAARHHGGGGALYVRLRRR